MRTPPLLLAGALLLTGCAAAPMPSPTPSRVYFTGAPLVPAPPDPTPTVLTPDADDGTVTGMYGRRLRLIPSDPNTTFACRALTANEKKMTSIRYKVSDPSPAAAVDVGEGWSVVAWSNKGETLAFVTDGGEYEWGTTYQAIPANWRWRGTHTNAGIALADGALALDAALRCIGEG